MSNPLNNFMKQQLNPQQLLMNFMQQRNNNPMINNLINMAQKGNVAEVEKFARNLFKESGRDFDKEFSSFMQNFKR
jgi:hypothetical protein